MLGSERPDCYDAIETLLSFDLRHVAVPDYHDISVVCMDKAGALGDHVGLFVSDISPNSWRISKARECGAQHAFSDASGGLYVLAMFRWHLAIETIVYDQPAAKKRILKRRIVYVADCLIIVQTGAIEGHEVPRIVRGVRAETATEEVTNIEFGFRDFLDSKDV